MHRGNKRWRRACGFLAGLVLLSPPVRAAGDPVRADVASLKFTRTQAPGLESALPRIGTDVKILLTQGDSNWRAIDFDSSRVTALVDGDGHNLEVSDTMDTGGAPGIQPDGSTVSPDGQKAVLDVWGGGLPANEADTLRVAGSVVIFCGPSEELSVDRTQVRLAGGETFNVQPFRVVTTRTDEGFQVELRYLKSTAYVRGVTLDADNGPMDVLHPGRQSSAGQEWSWRGDFKIPSHGDQVTLTVRYLPIDKVETVPYDVTVGVAFGTPPSNPIVRWLRRAL